VKIQLRNTALNYFCDCETKFYHGVVRSRQLKERPDYYSIGSLYHEGMKVLLHPINKNKNLQDRFNDATKHMRNYAEENSFSQEVYETALGLLRAYFTKYPEDPDVDIISVEQELSRALIDRKGLKVVYEATIDAIGRTKDSYKRLALIEHKSTSGYGSTYSRSITHSPQVDGFAWVGEGSLKEPIELVIVNYGVKTRQPRAERDKVVMNSNRIQKWYDFAVHKAERIAKAIQTNVYDRNHYHCHTTRSTCPYVQLCWHGENDATLQLYEEVKMGRPTSKITL